jgi:hypothetical protein
MAVFFELVSVFIIVTSFVGLGSFLIKLLQIDKTILPVNGLLGAGFFSFIVSILGHFLSLFKITFILITIGFFFSSIGIIKKSYSFKLHLPRIVALYLVFAFFVALYPSTYFDPLNYHLYGIVEWSKLDKLVHIKSAIQIMHDSYGDYLYFPFSFWWGQSDLKDLISLQITCQLFTVCIGISFFSLILFELVKDRFEKIWIPLLLISALTRASLQHKGFIAKNDWIALSWFLSAVYLQLTSFKDKKNSAYVSSFFMGLSIGTKLTYFAPAGIFFIWFAVKEKIKIDKKLIISFIIFFLTLLPYLLRNYFWTGSPVFPLAHNIFPTSFLGPSWIEGFKYFDITLNQLSFKFLQHKMIRIFTYEPLAYFSLVVPMFFHNLSSSSKKLFSLIFLFLIFFILFFGPWSELRHFGPIAISINMFGVIGISLISKRLSFTDNKKIFISYIFIGIITYNFLNLENQLNPLPSSLRKGVFFPRVQALLEENKGLKASQYLSKYKRKEFRLGLLDDTPPYFLSNHKVIRLWDDPDLDRSLKACFDLNCVVNVLDKEGINYLLESGFIFDPYYNLSVLNLIDNAVLNYPHVVIWANNNEKIVSIKKLSEVIKKNDF